MSMEPPPAFNSTQLGGAPSVNHQVGGWWERHKELYHPDSIAIQRAAERPSQDNPITEDEMMGVVKEAINTYDPNYQAPPKLDTTAIDAVLTDASEILTDLIYDDERLQAIAHEVACRQMGRDPSATVVGGDGTDRLRNYHAGMHTLQDDSQEAAEYYSYTNRFWSQILATAIARANFLRY